MSGPDIKSWMPFYWGSYLKNTMHLRAEGHGAYMLLLGACWIGDGSVPDDDDQLAAIARCDTKQWQRLRPTLAKFFQIGSGVWRQERLSLELERSKRLAELKQRAGRAGGEAKAAALAGAKQTPTPLPSPSPSKEVSPPPPSGSAPRKRGVTLGPSWAPSAADLSYADSRGFSLAEAQDLAANFREYWTNGKGRTTTKLDWTQAWQTWVRKEKPKGSNNGRTRPRTPTEALRDDPEFVAAARRLGGLRGGAGPAGEEPPAEGPHAGDDRSAGEGGWQVPSRTLRIAAGSPGGDSPSDHTRFGDVDRVSAAIGLGAPHRPMVGVGSGEGGPGPGASETSERGAPAPSHARVLDAEDRGREVGRELAASGLDAGRVGPAEIVGSEADRPQANRLASPRVVDMPDFLDRRRIRSQG